MAEVDPYRVLQIVPSADQEVVHAAFRALALKYHPDRDPSPLAQRRMLELNAAYSLVRDARVRGMWDRARSRQQPSAEPTSVRGTPPPRSPSAGTRVTFGRYQGWTLRDLARHDPDYLRWLSRHSSGIAYRTEIYQILGRMGATAA